VAALLAEALEDTLAARAVLQVLAPALAGISRRCWRAVGAGRTWSELAELDQEVVTTAYDQILRLATTQPLPSWPTTAVADATDRGSLHLGERAPPAPCTVEVDSPHPLRRSDRPAW